jgi:hypothetical protein
MPRVAATFDLFYSGVWNAITSFVYTRDGVSIVRGRSDEAGGPEPGTMRLTLNNRDGRFSPRNPRSPLFGLIGRNTPIRASVDGDVRFVGEVSEWPPEWDASGNDVYVPVEASGILRRLGSGAKPLESPLMRHYLGFGESLVAYVPLEDGSDTVRMGANVVDGASAIRYDISGDRAPGWARDDTCPGSAPLPEWTPIEYFGWSVGASVLPHTGDRWEVHVTFRAPSGTASVVLCEWRTEGSVTDWELRVDSSGDLELFGTDGADTPTTVTVSGSSLGAVDDGVWRTCAVTGVDDPGFGMQIFIRIPGVVAAFGNPSGPTIGRVTAIRPRPMWQSAPPGGAEPIGLGHMAVSSRAHMPLGPADGHAGEGAPDRFLRLCRERLVPARLVSVPATVLDEFDRTETGGWGDADTGQTWTVQEGSAADLSVTDSAGVIDMAMVPGHVVTAAAGLRDVLVQAVVSPGQVAAGASFNVYVAGRAVDEDNFTAARLAFNTTGLMVAAVVQFVAGTPSVLTAPEVAVPFPYAAGSRFVVRVAMVGTTVEMRVWDADLLGVGNLRTASGATLASGDVGIASLLDVGNTNTDPTVAVEEFHAEAWVEPTRLGPQQRDTFLTLLGQVAKADLGVLAETRDRCGLTFRVRHSLYNQPPALTLDYTARQVSPPFHPTEDDRLLTNDVTVSRIDGSSSRTVLESGMLSVQDPPDGVGPLDTAVAVNVASDEQLSGQAGWRLHLGTWDEARWPQITVDLAARAFRDSQALTDAAAAVLEGDVVAVTGLPDWLPPETVRALVLGYRELFDDTLRRIVWAASPAGPFTVLEWAAQGSTPDPDAPSRWDSDGSTVASDFDAGTDTSLSVAVAGGSPLWTTDSGDLPLDIMAAGVRLRVTAISGSSSPQTFTATATPVNGVEKTIPAGSAVRLFAAVPWAL